MSENQTQNMKRCPLTDHPFDESFEKLPTQYNSIKYKFILVGIAEISTDALAIMEHNKDIKHLLAGICRNHFEKGLDPPIITVDMINSDIESKFNLPKSKKEKAFHLLKYMYNNGGNDLGKFKFSSTADRTLTYSPDFKEFIDIINYLNEEYLIKIGRDQTYVQGIKVYHDVTMTQPGIELVEEDLPKIPMIGLVDQEISTGDSNVDEKISHAKKLFFESDSKDNKRSACEALSYILEPLREDLKQYFSNGDVSDFFNIVNNFDIRHNKDHTKNLEHVEQLEWIFYSLLNTINTYTKLKSKLG